MKAKLIKYEEDTEKLAIQEFNIMKVETFRKTLAFLLTRPSTPNPHPPTPPPTEVQLNNSILFSLVGLKERQAPYCARWVPRTKVYCHHDGWVSCLFFINIYSRTNE